ncbi:HAD family hydrolase [Streptomyces sp. TRM 70361]|uniref:HAD family hydrolase n=1 Tax=Streptomyces sp. TRM 70361 TaxID=3116553 RepID=UPI002E7B13CA|nr:HAD family hydrolase [Streptomyces sp. TRM 70361]MEE1939869.1 HAD family hydrolase [Streptomyces sp. TRM 70361]
MPVRGVLFDVDDTLFDYSGSDETGFLAHLTAEGLLDRFPDPAAALALWREITRAEYARYTSGEITFAAHRHARVRAFLSRAGDRAAGAIPDEAAAAWFAAYVSHRDAAWRAFDDAAPVLARLAPRHRLGVVSNAARAAQRRKLAGTGLLAYFERSGEVLVCSEEHGEAKPAPGIFLAGCAALGLEPHEVAYVGDNHAVDAVGARDAGLRAYWLDRAGTGPVAPGDGITALRSLAELPAALVG